VKCSSGSPDASTWGWSPGAGTPCLWPCWSCYRTRRCARRSGVMMCTGYCTPSSTFTGAGGAWCRGLYRVAVYVWLYVVTVLQLVAVGAGAARRGWAGGRGARCWRRHHYDIFALGRLGNAHQLGLEAARDLHLVQPRHGCQSRVCDKGPCVGDARARTSVERSGPFQHFWPPVYDMALCAVGGVHPCQLLRAHKHSARCAWAGRRVRALAIVVWVDGDGGEGGAARTPAACCRRQ
jgi:hypothetical protein